MSLSCLPSIIGLFYSHLWRACTASVRLIFWITDSDVSVTLFYLGDEVSLRILLPYHLPWEVTLMVFLKLDGGSESPKGFVKQISGPQICIFNKLLCEGWC